ncbi:hypothetical protein AV274_3208 [Blastocystis sp. ATCC 50177/Nand II]|uniref:protein-serine/threonine phosphatase n=1 Tax=Blastocystis sp. subtype 1 (strain ATCC 50177 / NandII) TaxID=478820 RepID=A0A196SDE8_BLAHN|nr:hypothetical protein AV274_3208 [Blastocystis sp. ATCC 50177/Nand II]
MNSEKEIAIKTDKKGTCIWLKEEGSSVYKSEEIGYVVVDKDFRTPVRAPIEGRIKKLVVHGDEVVDGTNEEATIAVIVSCLHAIVMYNVCLNCQKCFSDEELEGYHRIISSDGCVQYLHHDFYESERVETQSRLLRNRKLGLVFDLDHTLMEQTDDMRCMEAAKFGIPNVSSITFHRNGIPTSFVIILRPCVLPFLKELSSYFELSVYTNGIREYAEEVVKVLDPDHTLFGSRIIARNDVPDNPANSTEDNFVKESKDIRFVQPGFDTMGVAVDDCAAVWKDQSSVITVPKFVFWSRFARCLRAMDANGWSEEERRRQMFAEVGPVVNSTELMVVRDALLHIHRAFYEKVKRGADPYSRYLHDLVTAMGGKVVEAFGDTVTNFVSRGDETLLLVEVMNRPAGNCRVVSDAWVIACYSFLNVMASKAYPVRRVVSVNAADPDLADVLEDVPEEDVKEESESEEVSEEVKEVKEEVKEKKSVRREDRICNQGKNGGKSDDVEEMKKRRRRMFLG